MTRKLITLNNDGKLAIRAGDGTETVIPPRRTPNVLLLIDVSASMSYVDSLGEGYMLTDSDGSNPSSSIGQAKKGGAEFAYEACGKGYATALAIFADRAAMVCDPTLEPDVLTSKIAKLRPGMLGSNTDLEAGLLLAAKFQDLAAVVIVTDGQVQEHSVLKAAEPLKRREVEIICIGTGAANRAFLSQLATRSSLSAHVSTRDLSGAIKDASKLLPVGGRNVTRA
jgi:Mg-chelatase subunit ChlD